MAVRPTASSSSPTVATHRLYDEWRATWTTLYDLYEGAGGFLSADKPYLAAHPREWLDHTLTSTDALGQTIYSPNPAPTIASPKLKARRKIARYENVLKALIDGLVGALFRECATRSIGPEGETVDHPLQAFWSDVDGLGTHIDDWITEQWRGAAVFGHIAALMDRTSTAQPLTRADQSPLYVRAYTPLDVLDWLQDDSGTLTAVRLAEAVPRTSLDTRESIQWRLRTVTAEAVTVGDGRTNDTSVPHGFGTLPVALLYSQRRPFTALIGQPVPGDPQLYIDLYNLVSEVREIQRAQTFGLLNIPLGPDGDLERERQRVGASIGTANVLFSGQPAAYIQPDSANVSVYHEHIDRLLRQLHRLVGAPWDGDSRDAESAESRKLKREEFNQRLAAFADECERFEYALAKLWFRGTYGADGWQAEWERANVQIQYPDSFDPDVMADLLADLQAFIGCEVGKTATDEAKKRIVRQYLTDADPNLLAKAASEIDAQEDPAVVRQREREAAMAALTADGGPPDGE